MRKLWYDVALGLFFLLTFVALLFAAGAVDEPTGGLTIVTVGRKS